MQYNFDELCLEDEHGCDYYAVHNTVFEVSGDVPLPHGHCGSAASAGSLPELNLCGKLDKPVVPSGDDGSFKDIDDSERAKVIEQLRRTSVPTSLTEKQVLQRLQTLLKMPNFLERYLSDLPKREKETPWDFARRKESYIAQMAEGLSLETEAGVFGPATQKAFEKLLKFMDKEVSLTILELNKLQLELPAGCPLPLPSNIAQRPITPDYYRAQVSAGKLVFAGSIDSDKIPVAELAQLEAALFWIDKAHLSIRSVEAQRQDSVLNEMIEQESFPKGWRWKEGDDRAAWRVAAQCMIDLTKCASGYVAAFQNLFKGDRYDRVEVDLPPGTRVTVRKDDEERVITSFNLKEQDNLAFFKHGKVVRIDLALPQDLRQDEPHNKQLIERLRSWIDRHAPQIDKLMENVNTFKEALMYGDQEVGAGTRGVFENDVFVGLAVRGYRPGPTRTARSKFSRL